MHGKNLDAEPGTKTDASFSIRALMTNQNTAEADKRQRKRHDLQEEPRVAFTNPIRLLQSKPP